MHSSRSPLHATSASAAAGSPAAAGGSRETKSEYETTGEPCAAGGRHEACSALELPLLPAGASASVGGSGWSGAQQNASRDHALPSQPMKAPLSSSKRSMPRSEDEQRPCEPAAAAHPSRHTE